MKAIELLKKMDRFEMRTTLFVIAFLLLSSVVYAEDKILPEDKVITASGSFVCENIFQDGFNIDINSVHKGITQLRLFVKEEGKQYKYIVIDRDGVEKIIDTEKEYVIVIKEEE